MPDQGQPRPLQRHFVTVGGRFGPRQIHYRQGGRGPALLLLHQSPQSSREMEPLIEAWGSQFTVVAPDAPGYGFSEPLRRSGRAVAEASIEDFAAATLEFADALGLARFGIYGFHTGASVSIAMAEAAPERVAAVAANGLVLPTDAELEGILRDYLPPLVPQWDGSHLAWLWARVREQTIFFPWHDRRAATRMDFDIPPADRLQESVKEFLAAGAHYAVAYRAAFASHAERRLPKLRMPVLITASARDPLAGHLKRITVASPSVQVAPGTDAADVLKRAFEFLVNNHRDGDPGKVVLSTVGAAATLDLASEYGGEPGRQVRVLRAAARLPGARRTAILLHPPGGSGTALAPLAATIAGCADVLAVDLPGHGASDPAPLTNGGGALAGSVTQLAAALAPLLARARHAGHGVTLIGCGSIAPLAVELARALDATSAGARQDTGVVVLGPPAWAPGTIADWLEHGLPHLAATWSGGHLLEAWHLVRDRRLYSPWFRRDRAAIRPGEPDLENEGIEGEVRDLLWANGAWQGLLRELLLYPNAAGDLPGVGNTAPPVTRLVAPPAHWDSVLT